MRRLSAKVLVVGSGPGGATTAALCAEAGLDVLLVEDGDHLAVDATEPFSLDEMRRKWRNAGLTPALGDPKVLYVEGRCVGGASEINAALYHAPPAEILDGWRDRHRLEDFGADALQPHVEATARDVGVSFRPDGVGRASEKLCEGADALGWKTEEIARFWRYERGADGGWTGRRQSMSETLIPRALAAGARIEPGLRVRRLVLRGRRAIAAEAVARDGGRVRLEFDTVFLCAGAVQTPLILRRSGIRRGIGDTLTLNPMVRVAARFPDVVNHPEEGVPVQQVSQFKPAMTIGCSHSSLPHLALWMVGPAAARDRMLAEWPRWGVYYAKVIGQTRGKVRNVPLVDEALVRFSLTPGDLDHLALGLHRLGRMLFAAGAQEIINPIPGGPPIRQVADLEALRGEAMRRVQISAIHLHSTVPLGEPTDSFGRLRALDNAWVNDSALLPDTPGINPQATILAMARRNALRFLRA